MHSELTHKTSCVGALRPLNDTMHMRLCFEGCGSKKIRALCQTCGTEQAAKRATPRICDRTCSNSHILLRFPFVKTARSRDSPGVFEKTGRFRVFAANPANSPWPRHTSRLHCLKATLPQLRQSNFLQGALLTPEKLQYMMDMQAVEIEDGFGQCLRSPVVRQFRGPEGSLGGRGLKGCGMRMDI